jgi:hypothetical protein
VLSAKCSCCAARPILKTAKGDFQGHPARPFQAARFHPDRSAASRHHRCVARD